MQKYPAEYPTIGSEPRTYNLYPIPTYLVSC